MKISMNVKFNKDYKNIVFKIISFAKNGYHGLPKKNCFQLWLHE